MTFIMISICRMIVLNTFAQKQTILGHFSNEIQFCIFFWCPSICLLVGDGTNTLEEVQVHENIRTFNFPLAGGCFLQHGIRKYTLMAFWFSIRNFNISIYNNNKWCTAQIFNSILLYYIMILYYDIRFHVQFNDRSVLPVSKIKLVRSRSTSHVFDAEKDDIYLR